MALVVLVPPIALACAGRGFEAARARGTAEAYREFLEEFEGSSQAQRARGNAAYVEARGFGGRSDALSDFAARHPESDFAAEAARSAASLEARARSGFQRAGLVIEFSPSTPGKQRLAQVFAELADGRMSSGGFAAETTVTLVRRGDPEPIWSRVTRFRAARLRRP